MEKQTQTQSFSDKLSNAAGKSSTASPRYQRKNKASTKNDNAIKDNPFYKAASNPNPHAQKKEMVELMTFTDKETTVKNAEALEAYTAFMQKERQRIAVELIEMTDTKTFSNLQSVLVDINTDMLDFEDQIKPLMEILNAVREIQDNGATADIFAEIKADSEKSGERELKIESLEIDILGGKALINSLRDSIVLWTEDKGFFGFGSTKPEAMVKIAKAKTQIEEVEQEQKRRVEEINTLKAVGNSETKFQELSASKDVLANMLDLTADEHSERHQRLLDTAKSFVETTQERVGETLDHSESMSGQIKSLSDLSFTMRTKYTTLSEAAKEAERVNSDRHEDLKAEKEKLGDENPLDALENESTQRDIAKHINTLNATATDTATVLQDITISGQRIESLEEANSAQIKQTRAIQTSGIAGVADNLSSVLTAIGQAAIGQASTAAQQSLQRMNENTMDLSKEQLLNMAKSRNDDNAALIRTLENLSGYGEVIDLANSNTHAALAEQREIVDTLRTTANEVNEAVKESVALASTVVTEDINS